MSASRWAPGAQQKRFAAYLESLARAAGHADRAVPLESYCTGLLLPGERKSVEPLAARLAPHDVQRVHQSLHHFVANAPWSDEALLERVRYSVLPAMKRNGPVTAWIVDDTGFVKKGTHSVGVVRQYCGQVGKQENCRVAVSLSLATEQLSLPIAWRLYLPEIWAKDYKRRKATGVPKEVTFATKPAIALQQIQKAVEEEVTKAPVLADAAYGNDSQFREGLCELGLEYVVGVQKSTTVWRSGTAPRPAKRWKGMGRPPTLLRRDKQHQPVAVKKLAESTPPYASRPMASWLQNEAVFPPLPVPDSWTYAPGKFRPTSSLAAHRVRAIHTRSLHYESGSQDFSSNSLRAAHIVVPDV